MGKKKINNGDANPMSYFADGASPDVVITSMPRPLMVRLQESIDAMIGLDDLKNYLIEQKEIMALNIKRHKFGMSVFSRGELIVLSGSGDHLAAIDRLLDFYEMTGRISNKKFQYLDLETVPSYWHDTARSTIHQSLKDAEKSALVVHGLGDLMDSMSEGAPYALNYFTKVMGQIDFSETPVILLASRAELKRWHALATGMNMFKRRVVPVCKYSPDDLTRQFIRHARFDGYAIAPYLRARIKDIFAVVHSLDFQRVNTNDLAMKVYRECQDRQLRRLVALPDTMQTARRLRCFKKQDLVKFIAPCERDVIIV